MKLFANMLKNPLLTAFFLWFESKFNSLPRLNRLATPWCHKNNNQTANVSLLSKSTVNSRFLPFSVWLVWWANAHNNREGNVCATTEKHGHTYNSSLFFLLFFFLFFFIRNLDVWSNLIPSRSKIAAENPQTSRAVKAWLQLSPAVQPHRNIWLIRGNKFASQTITCVGGFCFCWWIYL